MHASWLGVHPMARHILAMTGHTSLPNEYASVTADNCMHCCRWLFTAGDYWWIVANGYLSIAANDYSLLVTIDRSLLMVICLLLPMIIGPLLPMIICCQWLLMDRCQWLFVHCCQWLLGHCCQWLFTASDFMHRCDYSRIVAMVICPSCANSLVQPTLQGQSLPQV